MAPMRTGRRGTRSGCSRCRSCQTCSAGDRSAATWCTPWWASTGRSVPTTAGRRLRRAPRRVVRAAGFGGRTGPPCCPAAARRPVVDAPAAGRGLSDRGQIRQVDVNRLVAEPDQPSVRRPGGRRWKGTQHRDTPTATTPSAHRSRTVTLGHRGKGPVDDASTVPRSATTWSNGQARPTDSPCSRAPCAPVSAARVPRTAARTATVRHGWVAAAAADGRHRGAWRRRPRQCGRAAADRRQPIRCAAACQDERGRSHRDARAATSDHQPDSPRSAAGPGRGRRAARERKPDRRRTCERAAPRPAP